MANRRTGPRHSNNIELCQVYNHHVGRFTSMTTARPPLVQIEMHCTCGWHVKLVKYAAETPAQHMRRAVRRTQDHFEKVLEHEHPEEPALHTLRSG
jgi:hypothetical protein